MTVPSTFSRPFVTDSAAERLEFSRDYWDRTGNRYLLENTPYVDARPWDNIGFSERVPNISGFDSTQCHRYAP